MIRNHIRPIIKMVQFVLEMDILDYQKLVWLDVKYIVNQRKIGS